jgi:hypothetical protein
MRRLIPVLAIALILVAALIFSTSRLPVVQAAVGDNPAAAPAALAQLSSPRVMAWNPNAKQVAWYSPSGQPTTLAELSSDKALVTGCGLAPTGDKMVLYLGGTTAQPSLYPLNSADKPLDLGANIGLACIPGRTQFSPDGARLGLIKYGKDATEGNFTIGTLRVLKLPEGVEDKAMDNVVSFDLQNDGVVALQFFANTKNEANAADIVFWDAAANKERKLEENVKPLENCQFSVGRAVRGGDKVYTLIGEKCKGQGMKWRIIRTDFAGGNSVNVADGQTGAKGTAAYVNSAGQTDMWVLPGGTELLFSVPNGTAADLVDLYHVPVAGGNEALVKAGVVIEQYPQVAQSRFLRSPKGDMLALITRDGNGAEQLFTFDLSAPGNAPLKRAGGDRIDRISGAAWTAEGDRLFYVTTGQENGLFSVGAKEEKPKLIVRGAFQGLAVGPDGGFAATSEVRKENARDIRNDLVLITIADQSKVKLVEGAKGEGALVPIILR